MRHLAIDCEIMFEEHPKDNKHDTEQTTPDLVDISISKCDLLCCRKTHVHIICIPQLSLEIIHTVSKANSK